MTKRDKRLQKWKSNPKKSPEWSSVEAELVYHGFEIDKSGGGSHFQISHPLLIGQPDYGMMGEMTISLVSGKKLRPWALMSVIKAIETVIRIKNETE